MPEPEREAEAETEQTTAQAAGFGAAPAKAVPVNAPDAAKGQKRGRDEEEEEEQDDAEMEIEAKNFDGSDDEAKPPQVQHGDWYLIEFIDMLLDTDLTAFLWIAGFFSWADTDDFKMLSFYRPGLILKNIFYGDWQYDTVHFCATRTSTISPTALRSPVLALRLASRRTSPPPLPAACTHTLNSKCTSAAHSLIVDVVAERGCVLRLAPLRPRAIHSTHSSVHEPI
jgi:hypothetical protein